MISDKEVSDHHAIIPTMEIEKADLKLLPVGERNLLLLVCCKLLCASAEPYVYEAVTATFDCCGHSFTAKGKRILSEGWRRSTAFSVLSRKKSLRMGRRHAPGLHQRADFWRCGGCCYRAFYPAAEALLRRYPPVRYGERRQG